MNIYEIKNKLNELNKKIKSIKGLNYDVTALENEFNILNDKLNNYLESNSPTLTLSKQDNKVLISINILIDQFNEYIDSLSKKFKIFSDIDLVSEQINNDITEEKLNKIVELILNDMLSYIDLYKSGYKSGKEDELFEKIYKIIKCEFKIKGSSSLFSGLINMSVGNSELKKLVDKDVKDYLSNKDIYKRYNEVLSINSIDPVMVYLLALNEDDFKNTILGSLDEKTKLLDEVEEEYKKQLEIKKSKIRSKKHVLSNFGEGFGKSLKLILPNILSISILISANLITHNLVKDNTKYKTRMSVYDTVSDESYEENTYSNLNEDQVLIRVYDALEDGSANRSYTDYVIPRRDIDISEYANLRLTDADKTETGNVSNEKFEYNETNEKIIKVSIPEEINFNDNDNLAFLVVLYHILATFLAVFIDVFAAACCEELGFSTGNLTYNIICFQDFMDELDEMMEYYKDAVNAMNERENGKYVKEKYLEAKKRYDEAKKEYEILLQKYKKHEDLLEYNGYTRKLK